MRIISDFNDYYDSIRKYDTDTSLIFKRSQIIHTSGAVFNAVKKMVLTAGFRRYYSPKDLHLFDNFYPFTVITKDKKTLWLNIQHMLIIFAGSIIPAIKVDNHFFYSFLDYERFLRENGIYEQVIEEFKYKNKNLHMTRKLFEYNFGGIEDVLVENKMVIGVFMQLNGVFSIIENPKLESFQFQKIKDPYTAYMELEMYLSGKVGFPGNVMVELSDVSRLEKHGFDKRISFRHRK